MTRCRLIVLGAAVVLAAAAAVVWALFGAVDPDGWTE